MSKRRFITVAAGPHEPGLFYVFERTAEPPPPTPKDQAADAYEQACRDVAKTPAEFLRRGFRL